jgi:hypothetical protein
MSILISDLIIVIGTSMCVAPFNRLPGLAPGSIPLVIMNKEPIAHFEGRGIYIPGNCDESISSLCRELGWEKDLRKLHRQANGGQVPKSQRWFLEMQLVRSLGSIVSAALSLLSFVNRKRNRSNPVKRAATPNDIRKIHDRGNRKQKRRQREPKKKSQIRHPVMYDCIEVM